MEKEIKNLNRENAEKHLVTEAKKLNKYLEIEVTIRMFGNIIFNWIYPPRKEKEK